MRISEKFMASTVVALSAMLIAGAGYLNRVKYQDWVGDLDLQSVPTFQSQEDVRGEKGDAKVLWNKSPNMNLLAFYRPSSLQTPKQWMKSCIRDQFNQGKEYSEQKTLACVNETSASIRDMWNVIKPPRW